MEKICGITWRDPVTRTIVPIDLVDGEAVSTSTTSRPSTVLTCIVWGHMPAGKILAEVADDEIPYAESWKVIKMKDSLRSQA